MFKNLDIPDRFSLALCNKQMLEVFQVSHQTSNSRQRVHVAYIIIIGTTQNGYRRSSLIFTSVVYPFSFDADPDPAFQLDADPDPDPGSSRNIIKNLILFKLFFNKQKILIY